MHCEIIARFNFHRFDSLVADTKLDPRQHRYSATQQTVTSLLYSATTGDVTALRRLHSQGTDMAARWAQDRRMRGWRRVCGVQGL